MNSRFRTVVAVLVTALLAGACTSSDPNTSPSSVPLVTTTASSTTAGPTTAPSTTPATSTTTSTTTSTIPVPVELDENGFNDHAVSDIASRDEFFALAREDVSGRSVVKFNIPDMTRRSEVNWMDSNFYSLHDEWYYFRLLNGQSVPAIDVQPIGGQSFGTIAEIYEWADRRGGNLPGGLRVIDADDRNGGDRVYAPEFYRQAINVEPRNYGAGSLFYLPESADDGGERWLIELEYSDDVTADEVAVYFDRLSAALPTEVADRLEWVLRSPEHEDTAELMWAQELPYHDRIVRFSDLVAPGEVQVYNEGIAAGRLLLIEEGRNDLTDATDESIVLVENVPDYLPPATALISASPQTPLAHVNILARNRGIPNVSLAGVLDDPGIRQAARIRGHAIVRATEADGLEIVLITREEYNDWVEQQTTSSISVPAVEGSTIDYFHDLTELADQIESDADLERLRPEIGGKAAGMVTILRASGVTAPDTPLAITVRAYQEHLTPLMPFLDAMFASRDFRESSRARFLLLEGPDAFAERYPDDNDVEFLDRFRADNPASSTLGRVLDAGGFVEMIEDQPIPDATLAQLESGILRHFRGLEPEQGLRFRSSSSVEDIEGFNGAGLYDSNTGFMSPEILGDEDDQKKSIARALRKTWASYWGVEAVEERILERVDHRSGGMAVLVHPRFDDELEMNNGVATFTVLPDNADDGAVATINVQVGDTSVTNPEEGSGILPEAIEVTVGSQGDLSIDRRQQSSLLDEAVLSDEAVEELIAQLESVASAWLADVNRDLPATTRRSTLTIDVEFKTMAAGWPDRRGGSEAPARLIVKQARSLEPSTRGLPESVLTLPVPPDVLARAASVVVADCEIRIRTDELLAPDMGYSASAWTGRPDVCPASLRWSSPAQTLADRLEAGPNLALIG